MQTYTDQDINVSFMSSSCQWQSEHFICSSAGRSVCRTGAQWDVNKHSMSPNICVFWSLSNPIIHTSYGWDITITRHLTPMYVYVCVTVCVTDWCCCLTRWFINTAVTLVTRSCGHSPIQAHYHECVYETQHMRCSLTTREPLNLSESSVFRNMHVEPM